EPGGKLQARVVQGWVAVHSAPGSMLGDADHGRLRREYRSFLPAGELAQIITGKHIWPVRFRQCLNELPAFARLTLEPSTPLIGHVSPGNGDRGPCVARESFVES